MYLKSIEVHGFKSFANRIVFEFHNGITAIVGPNGSGKSNVADAVRWVLGEQSARQLRGANMQDVIFSGTESRKPMGFAYVAITLDNADHQLNIDYNEVTIARRIYRSGESEYLMNGVACRLKDVNELFYDTGIGKEGYSIIGQGQIERILSGKPEERRELFDEAAGIVKFKRRKAEAQKKLEDERQNLVRIEDILSEQEKQIGPLEQQAEKARDYLKKKEELKGLDVNLFLLEAERIHSEIADLEKKIAVAEADCEEARDSFEKAKERHEQSERDMARLDEEIGAARDSLGEASARKEKLEGQINVLKEQINSARQSEEHFASRKEALEQGKEERQTSLSSYEEQAFAMEEQLAAAGERREQAAERLADLQREISRLQEDIERGKNDTIGLLNGKADTQAKMQHYETMLEQLNIRKAQLNKQLLERKGEEEEQLAALSKAEAGLAEVESRRQKLEAEEQELEAKRQEWQEKQAEASRLLEEDTREYNRQQSRLESMVNIAERYDGYGGSIRKVMERRGEEPGILGVVADLLQVEKKYEVAIETALGGSIQNIVTEDEDTAKKMIAYLKQNRYGRATFLPLTSVGKAQPQLDRQALGEPGVIGAASGLVRAEARFEGIVRHLLGRTYVVDDIDHAVALARKYHYALRIVTLEGESLSPGGSMTGGAFKNAGNLLGRRREIEDLQKQVSRLEGTLKERNQRLLEVQTARELQKEDLAKVREDLQAVLLEQNTAQLTVERAREQKRENDGEFQKIQSECHGIDEQAAQIRADQEATRLEASEAEEREREIEQEGQRLVKILEGKTTAQEGLLADVSNAQLEEEKLRQQAGFARENVERIRGELAKLAEELTQIGQEAARAQDDITRKQGEIEGIRGQIASSEEDRKGLEQKLAKLQKEKESLAEKQKGLLGERESLSERIGSLDKELFRLNGQKERQAESLEQQNNYMWEEYQLTYHNALELRDAAHMDAAQMKRRILDLKDEIRGLGDVNVNAIEDYKELSERHAFLGAQHEDLIQSEQALVGIIEDLDTGMRKQFLEKFAEIQMEFDKAFKELFGGGKGTLELVEDEDILESGIRIIAQPPGKKLQNMMQLSGGEKSLTAIALLFAIQNMKPSPFCLLDEIEAALDDSNVGRFAQYLHRLTKNTQFIVITHRRGTMAAADRLYGITMQEKGVSTLVSVSLIEDSLEE